jgi:hypothetical protein
MLRRTAMMLMGSAMVAGLASPATAQVKLEYKFPEGMSATYRTTSKTHQILTIAGMNLETGAEASAVTSNTVGKRNADGTLPVGQKVESLKIQLDLPGGINISFDSANPDAKIEAPQLAFLGEAFKTLVGLSYTVVLDEHNRVKAVEGMEKVTAKLEGIDPQAANLIKGRLKVESIKRSFEMVHTNLPDILVRQGEPWERTEVMEIDGGQTLTFKKRYEYLGTVEQGGRTLDKIDVKALEVSYAMDPDADSPLRPEKSDLKIDSSDGTLLFDREAGTIVERKGKTRIKGDITFTANGQELPSQLDLTIDSATVQEAPAK